MKKILRRIVCLALTVCMMLSLGCLSAFADNDVEDYPHFSTYTVLGDSNASGYGLTEYAALGKIIADGEHIASAYAGIVSAAINAEQTNWCAHSAWRTTDFLRAVGYEGFSFIEEPDSPYKEYIADRSWVRNGQLFISAFGMMSFTQEELKTAIDSGISSADLISIQFGANDIFTYMMLALIEKWGDIFSDLGNAESLDDAIAVLADVFENCPEDEKPTLIADVVNGCEAGIEMFKANYPKIIDYIKSLKKEDAKVVVLGVLNPMEDMLNYSQYIDLDIFTLSDLSCAKANTFLYSLCANEEDFYYVSTTDADGYGLPALNWDAVINGVDLEPIFAALKIVHPSEKGHAEIASRILNTLTAELKTPSVSVSGTASLGRIKLNWKKLPNAVSYRVYRSTHPDSGYYLVGAVCDTSFTDLATVPGVTYYYKVSAVLNLLGTVRTACSESVSAQAKSALLTLSGKIRSSLK